MRSSCGRRQRAIESRKRFGSNSSFRSTRSGRSRVARGSLRRLSYPPPVTLSMTSRVAFDFPRHRLLEEGSRRDSRLGRDVAALEIPEEGLRGAEPRRWKRPGPPRRKLAGQSKSPPTMPQGGFRLERVFASMASIFARSSRSSRAFAIRAPEPHASSMGVKGAFCEITRRMVFRAKRPLSLSLRLASWAAIAPVPLPTA